MSQSGKNALFAVLGLLVAGGLAGYAYFGVMKPEDAANQRKEIDERVFSAAATVKKPDNGQSVDVRFTEVEVHAKGETTKLQRVDDRWMIVTPVKAPADRFALDTLVSQLQTAKFKEKLEEKPGDAELAKYGLKEPRFTVSGTASFPDGTTKTLKLEGGIDNPFDGSVYMRRDQDPAVYTAEGGLRYAMEKNTFDLRDKQVFALDEAKLTAVELKSENRGWALVRDDKKQWRMVNPVEAKADAQALKQLVKALSDQRAEAFFEDTAQKRKDFGLETPAAVLSFTDADGVTKISLASAGKHSFGLVERGDSAQLVQIPSTLLAAVAKKPEDLKDKSILQFDGNAVAKVVIAPGDGPQVVVERTGDAWKVTAAEVRPAKAFKISALIWNLGNLKAEENGEENPKDWARYGIGPKSLTVTFADAAGKTLGTFVRGNESAERPGLVYARGSRNQVAEVDAARLSDLPTTVTELAVESGADAGSGEK